MELTYSQAKHLRAIVELADETGEPVTRAQLHERVFGHRRRSNPSVSRAVNALAAARYITLVPEQEQTQDTYQPTDAGRAALATEAP